MKYPTRDGWTLGIDAYAGQGLIDFAALRQEANAQFAILQASTGSRGADVFFAPNAKRAREAGLLVGAYHVLRPAEGAAAQVEQFNKIALTGNNHISMRPMCDVELIKGATYGQLAQVLKDWCAGVAEAWGCRVIVYSYPSFLAELHKAAPVAMASVAMTCDLLIAHYGPPKPTIPAPWTHAQGWQFDGNGGLKLPNGVDADFNWFFGEAAALRETWGWPAESPSDEASDPEEETECA